MLFALAGLCNVATLAWISGVLSSLGRLEVAVLLVLAYLPLHFMHLRLVRALVLDKDQNIRPGLGGTPASAVVGLLYVFGSIVLAFLAAYWDGVKRGQI